MESEVFIAVVSTREGMREPFLRAWQHAEAMVLGGERVEVRVGPALEAIGVQQRKFLHGPVLGQIAEQVRVGDEGVRFVVEVWKEHFRTLFLGWNWEMRRSLVRDPRTGAIRPAKKATPHRVPVSSETLGVRKYSEWTNQIIDHAVAELGVVFVFNDGEREAVRWTPRRRGQDQ